MWRALTMLSEISLDRNQLTGPLPQQWTALVLLEDLDLSWNRLTGAVDAAWQSMPSLLVFDVRMNGLIVSALSDRQLPDGWQVIPQDDAQLEGPTESGAGAGEWPGTGEGPAPGSPQPPVDVRGGIAVPGGDADLAAEADGRRLLALTTSIRSHDGVLEAWQAGTDHCDWPGVMCFEDGSRRVRQVALNNRKLSGTLPDEWSGLERLEGLQFKFNYLLSGPLPASWSALTALSSL